MIAERLTNDFHRERNVLARHLILEGVHRRHRPGRAGVRGSNRQSPRLLSLKPNLHRPPASVSLETLETALLLLLSLVPALHPPLPPAPAAPPPTASALALVAMRLQTRSPPRTAHKELRLLPSVLHGLRM
jgi:hypothetical protein